MNDRFFIDSNTVLYIYDHDAEEKRERARAWLSALTDIEIATTNLQVLNEITNVFLRRMKQWTPDYTFEVVDTFAELGSAPLTSREIIAARSLRIRYRYSWWDCLLLASALELGCRHFLSEDLPDGQVIEGLTIIDPFAHSPDQILASR